MRYEAEHMKLEYSLGLSQTTSEGILKYCKKTQADIKKILWECSLQISLIDDYTQTASYYWISDDQKYQLHEQQNDAQILYDKLSQI